MDDIFRLLDDWVMVVAPKTPLGKAIGYARNRQVQLSRFLQDGRIPLDNGKVERLIRGIAVGRKNWLFIGSDAAAKRAANIYSVILSCQLIGIDPWAYLKDVLPKLGSCSFPHSRLSELLPEEWHKRQTQADRYSVVSLGALARAYLLPSHSPSISPCFDPSMTCPMGWIRCSDESDRIRPAYLRRSTSTQEKTALR